MAERTEPTFGSVFTQALGKGLADYSIERQKAQDVGRENALLQYKAQMEQAQRKQDAQEAQLRMTQLRLRNQQINAEMEKARIEGAETPEQKHARKLEEIKATYEAQQANKLGFLDAIVKRGVTSTGRSATPTTNPNLIGKFTAPLIQMLGQNTQIGKTNAATMGKYGQMRADAIGVGDPIPPVPDTLPHINIPNMMFPMMNAAGVDSSQAAQFLSGFGVQTPPVAVPKTINDISIEELMNMTDEELKALVAQ